MFKKIIIRVNISYQSNYKRVVFLNLTIDVKDHEKETTLFLQGEIDIYTVDQIKRELLPLTKINGQTIIVNFKDVNYMDSTGLGLFIKALKFTKEHNSKMILTHLQERIARLFKITGLDEMFLIEQTVGWE